MATHRFLKFLEVLGSDHVIINFNRIFSSKDSKPSIFGVPPFINTVLVVE